MKDALYLEMPAGYTKMLRTNLKHFPSIPASTLPPSALMGVYLLLACQATESHQCGRMWVIWDRVRGDFLSQNKPLLTLPSLCLGLGIQQTVQSALFWWEYIVRGWFAAHQSHPWAQWILFHTNQIYTLVSGHTEWFAWANSVQPQATSPSSSWSPQIMGVSLGRRQYFVERWLELRKPHQKTSRIHRSRPQSRICGSESVRQLLMVLGRLKRPMWLVFEKLGWQRSRDDTTAGSILLAIQSSSRRNDFYWDRYNWWQEDFYDYQSVYIFR